MNRTIDDLGRIVIPIEYRRTLNITDHDILNVELVEQQIIITKKDAVDYKKIVEEAIDRLYFYSEVLEPKFQKEMLDILNNK